MPDLTPKCAGATDIIGSCAPSVTKNTLSEAISALSCGFEVGVK